MMDSTVKQYTTLTMQQLQVNRISRCEEAGHFGDVAMLLSYPQDQHFPQYTLIQVFYGGFQPEPTVFSIVTNLANSSVMQLNIHPTGSSAVNFQKLYIFTFPHFNSEAVHQHKMLLISY